MSEPEFSQNPFLKSKKHRTEQCQLKEEILKTCNGPAWDAIKPHLNAIFTISKSYSHYYGADVGEEVLQELLILVPKVWDQYIPEFGTSYRSFMLAWMGNHAKKVYGNIRKSRQNEKSIHAISSENEEFEIEIPLSEDLDENFRALEIKDKFEKMEELDRWLLEQRHIYMRPIPSITKLYNGKVPSYERVSDATISRMVKVAETRFRSLFSGLEV